MPDLKPIVKDLREHIQAVVDLLPGDRGKDQVDEVVKSLNLLDCSIPVELAKARLEGIKEALDPSNESK